jgi:hypothetical protein
MKISKTAEDAFLLTLTADEAQIFVNSMKETLKCIPAREYWTRMGAKPDEMRSTIGALEAALK